MSSTCRILILGEGFTLKSHSLRYEQTETIIKIFLK